MKLDRYEISKAGRRRLSGQIEQRGSRTGFSTWGTFLFGGVFVACGTIMILIGRKMLPVEPSTVHAPYWILSVAGLVFAIGGLMVWAMAWKQHVANRHARKAAQLHRDEPAFADYDWDPRGIDGRRWKRASNAVGMALFLTLFLSIFNYFAFFFTKAPFFLKIVVGLFDAILLLAWSYAVICLGRALKFGGSRIQFPHFPYRLSEPVVIRWQPATGIAEVRKGTFTLRCVEEFVERSGSGDNESAALVHEEIWSGTWVMERPRTIEPGKLIELSFELPAEVPSTRLSADKPVFWEFEVKLDLPGLDFVETYLVPIYGLPKTDMPQAKAA